MKKSDRQLQALTDAAKSISFPRTDKAFKAFSREHEMSRIRRERERFSSDAYRVRQAVLGLGGEV